MAGGAVEAGGAGAVVDVLAAVLARPAVDAHAAVAAVGVVARAPVLAGVGHQLALVHVLGAVLACGGTGLLGRAAAPRPRPSPRRVRGPPPPGSLPGYTPPPTASRSRLPSHLRRQRGLLSPCAAHRAPPGPAPACRRLQTARPRARPACHWPASLRPAQPARLTWGPRSGTGPSGAGLHRAPWTGRLAGAFGPRPHLPPAAPALRVRACPLGRAAAVVGVHAVHTGAPVLAAVPWAVVDVFLAVLAGKPCGGRSHGSAQPSPCAARCPGVPARPAV